MSAPEHFDVAVVGGGFAGIAAARTAARLGARTLLVERAAELGGQATQALVHTICGLYHAADADAPRHAHPGLPRALAERMRRAGAAGDPERAGRVFFLPTEPARLAAELAALCAAERRLAVRTGRALVTAAADAAGFALGLEAPGGAEAARARIAVDASGDAALAAALGAEAQAGAPDELQHPSYILRLEGVATDALQGFARLQLSVAVAGAARSGTLPAHADAVVVRPALAPGAVYVTLGVPKPAGAAYDPLDAAQRRVLEARARCAAEAVVAHLRAERPGFRAARVAAWPARLGVRESRRLCGLVELTRDDVLEGRMRPDQVAVSTWPIERWREHRRAHFEHPAGPCSIPLAALISRSHPRLAAAGRCMPGSAEALAALRVLGTALATGEAAGAAAARAADAGVTLAVLAADTVREAALAAAEGLS